MYQFEPVNGICVVEKIDGLEKTKGGLIIPEGSRNNQDLIMGKILSASKRHVDDPEIVVAGDVVMFDTYFGAKLETGGKTLFFIDVEKFISKVREV